MLKIATAAGTEGTSVTARIVLLVAMMVMVMMLLMMIVVVSATTSAASSSAALSMMALVEAGHGFCFECFFFLVRFSLLGKRLLPKRDTTLLLLTRTTYFAKWRFKLGTLFALVANG